MRAPIELPRVAQISRYMRAGVNCPDDMHFLHTKGICGRSALLYADCGLTTDEMVGLAELGAASWVLKKVIEGGIRDFEGITRAIHEMRERQIAPTEWSLLRVEVPNWVGVEFAERLFAVSSCPKFTATACKESQAAQEVVEELDREGLKTVVVVVEDGWQVPSFEELAAIVELLVAPTR